MKSRLITWVALICIIATVLPGCKKEGIDKTTVTVSNRLDRAVTFDIYAGKEDYAASQNQMTRKVIAAGEKMTFPGEMFQAGGVYYMDWYSEDYYYNNWYNDDYPVTGTRVRISPTPGNNTYYLDPTLKGQGRNAFLKGAGAQTTWIAIGAYLYSSSTGYTSQWDAIKTHERYRQITIKKDFTAEYSRRNAATNIVTEQLAFMVQQTEVPYIEFKAADGSIGGNMTGGKLPVATPPAYISNSIDTIMALFPDNEYLFMMVRQ